MTVFRCKASEVDALVNEWRKEEGSAEGGWGGGEIPGEGGDGLEASVKMRSKWFLFVGGG